MLNAAAVTAAFGASLTRADRRDRPFRHWLLAGVLPADIFAAAAALPFPAPSMNHRSGTREANNSARVFFCPQTQRRHPVCRAIADGLGAAETVARIEQTCGRPLGGSHLRVEYALDTDGFWLEPHTDIRVKLFTMLIYLAPDAPGADLGTDLYEGEETWACTAPFAPNAGMIFLPDDDTWHGFRPRPIDGVRRSLIVNFVTDDWRAREELSGFTATA